MYFGNKDFCKKKIFDFFEGYRWFITKNKFLYKKEGIIVEKKVEKMYIISKGFAFICKETTYVC